MVAILSDAILAVAFLIIITATLVGFYGFWIAGEWVKNKVARWGVGRRR